MKRISPLLSLLLIVTGVLLLLTYGCKKEEIQIMDADGNVYTEVVIGNQTWLKENLNTTRYLDSTEISLVTDNSAWAALTVPGYCYYGNDQAANGDVYGILYNWYTVNGGDLCPEGWHVPSISDIQELIEFAGADVAGNKLRETGFVYWDASNTGATNETGFSALGGGARESTGAFIGLLNGAAWWLADESSATSAGYFVLRSDLAGVMLTAYYKPSGMYVRCIKD